MNIPLVTNDAIVLGLLVTVLGLVFYTHSLGGGLSTRVTMQYGDWPGRKQKR